MVYDCDSWLMWPFCWIYFGYVRTVLQMLSLALIGAWAVRELRA